MKSKLKKKTDWEKLYNNEVSNHLKTLTLLNIYREAFLQQAEQRVKKTKKKTVAKK
jgi:hypothetical protein